MEERGSFWGSSRCAGLPDRGKEQALSGGASAARGCPIEGRSRLILRDLPLRGASRKREGGGPFLGISRCAGLLGRRREETLSGGAPAARGCSIEGGRMLYYWGDLPLRGDSCKREGRGSFLGSSRCAGLPVGWSNEALSGGAPAAQGCPSFGGREEALLLGGSPAARGFL